MASGPAPQSRLEKVWYGGRTAGPGLRLLSLLYGMLQMLHRSVSRLFAGHPGVPVIVVGNITVGGTGKTPLVARITELLQQADLRVGIVSRGYRSSAGAGPVFVSDSSVAASVGDEPLMLRRLTGAPVAVGSKRLRVARALVARHGLDVLVSDDGLQHHRLGRDLEIAVVDGQRRLGNGLMLPAGPLREPPRRLARVDYVVTNGGEALGQEVPMALIPGPARNLVTGGRRELGSFADAPVVAVAAIGNPGRFFDMLEDLGLQVEPKPFPDHHRFSARDVNGWADRTVLVTEKDAVKLSGLAGSSWWVVPVMADLPDEFEQQLVARVKTMTRENR
ncbi:MAG: tetraacyldisaccharide 4'-kinase [Xanthomonadales bacterium]|nr:tetraacyldisaccharide 4'-kinase [Xanthomonadales bacterium]